MKTDALNAINDVLERPGWQLALFLFTGFIVLFGGGAYCFLWPIWQQNQAIVTASVAAEASAGHYQQQLVALPPMEETERQIATLVAVDFRSKPIKAIAQVLVEPLSLSGGVLTRLQRKAVKGMDDPTRLRWSISLHADYQGLLALLESLLASPGLAVDLLNLQASATGLDVTLDLSTGLEQ